MAYGKHRILRCAHAEVPPLRLNDSGNQLVAVAPVWLAQAYGEKGFANRVAAISELQVSPLADRVGDP